MIRYASLFLLTLLVAVIFCLIYRKYNRTGDLAPKTHSYNISKIWVCIITCEVVILYSVLAFCISTAWLKGDDYIFFFHQDISLWEKLKIIAGRYPNSNGRLGDILGTLIGLSENRWEQVFITPCFILAIPFAMHRLIAPINQSIFSLRGAGFILFLTALLPISVSLTPWRNFWCFAASVNYIWPLPIICTFLSLFRTERRAISHKKIAIVTGFVFGLYSAWSLECVTLFLIPGICVWTLFRLLRKKHIPLQCAGGFVGALLGAFFLVSTPALSRRAAAEFASRPFNPSEYNWEQMLHFVTHQTPENLELLRASTVAYLLDGIPLILHVCYVPELISHFYNCCEPAFVVFLGLMAVHFICYKKQHKHTLIIGGSIAIFSVMNACSYLYSCIPSDMSFLPPSFILLTSCSYLYTRLQYKIGQAARCIVIAGVTCVSMFTIAPSIIEAAQYKKFEKLRFAHIHKQLSDGATDIILPPLYNVPPQDKLGLIGSMGLHDRPEDYPNMIAARSYRVNTIIQQPLTPSE